MKVKSNVIGFNSSNQQNWLSVSWAVNDGQLLCLSLERDEK